MNEQINWATPLYEFLRQCNLSNLPKNVLDCGAGGKEPPLSIFYNFGYECHGVEIDDDAWDEAQHYCREKNSRLNIIKTDMRKLPYPDKMFSFVYSYNAIFFMTKKDINIVIKEIHRVLKNDGLLYVNFVAVDDPNCAPFNKKASLLYKSKEFSQFEDNEGDEYFSGFKILRKEKRWIEKNVKNDLVKQVYVDYILRKI